ncbi:MAG: RNA polymerase sigma factor [Planctomycetota bacterium]
MKEDPDVQLMLRYQHGDKLAFEQLMTPEAFISVYRTAPRYEPIAKFSTWLYRIVANLSYNVLRSRGRGTARSLEGAYQSETDSSPWEVTDRRSAAPTAALDTRELANKLADAVSHLPVNQRIAIVLSKYEQKSHAQIADVLDCSVEAVKGLLNRARVNLRISLLRYL